MVVWTAALLPSIVAIRFAFYTLCEVVQMCSSPAGPALRYAVFSFFFFFFKFKTLKLFITQFTQRNEWCCYHYRVGWRVKQLLAGEPSFEQIASLSLFHSAVFLPFGSKKKRSGTLWDWLAAAGLKLFFLIGTALRIRDKIKKSRGRTKQKFFRFFYRNIKYGRRSAVLVKTSRMAKEWERKTKKDGLELRDARLLL
jgi:hypothetical protein